MLLAWALKLVVSLAAILTTYPSTADVQINGGNLVQQAQVRIVLSQQPLFLEMVTDTFPDFTVNICYGAHAWPGRISVSYRYEGAAFAELVAHEFAHEIQLAADARGGLPPLGEPWLQLLRSRSIAYDYANPVDHNRNPWEALAVHLQLTYWSEVCRGQTERRTVMPVLPAAEFDTWLTAQGISTPGIGTTQVATLSPPRIRQRP